MVEGCAEQARERYDRKVKRAVGAALEVVAIFVWQERSTVL
jgi:hypothetical protein